MLFPPAPQTCAIAPRPDARKSQSHEGSSQGRKRPSAEIRTFPKFRFGSNMLQFSFGFKARTCLPEEEEATGERLGVFASRSWAGHHSMVADWFQFDTATLLWGFPAPDQSQFYINPFAV